MERPGSFASSSPTRKKIRTVYQIPFPPATANTHRKSVIFRQHPRCHRFFTLSRRGGQVYPIMYLPIKGIFLTAQLTSEEATNETAATAGTASGIGNTSLSAALAGASAIM